ncbi:poly-beta-1,6 N-acetyl-D-glucosamine export porin PgaA [Castellaniella sp.]|uniref:poly-beta-1,6 N-acetyl-D-glucosamine export porin PgaA n=1 Tax=Castellaniella sp. TaxID=1955812 RepID=UPI003C77F9D8
MSTRFLPIVFTFCTVLALPDIAMCTSIQKYDILIQEARTHRDAQQWDQALALFKEGEQQFPQQSAFTLGYIMTLADAGHTDEAIRLGRQLVSRHPDSADSHLVLDYAYYQAHRPYDALESASQAYRLSPGKAYVVRSYIQALQRARLSQAALNLANTHPGVLKPAEIRALQTDVAAQLTRAAAAESRGEDDRFLVADQALAMYDTLIPQWEALGPSAQPQLNRAKADRLQALQERQRWTEVVSSYESMQAAGIPIPNYALGDVAAAYLALHQPEKAAPLFEKSLAASAEARPSADVLTDTTGLFYALTESGHYATANETLHSQDDKLPTWIVNKGDPRQRPNPLKLDVAQTQALGMLYENQTLKAQAQLDEMVAAAPENASLRTARSQVYIARDLPRAAEKDLKIAENQTPRSIEVELNQASAAMDLQEWGQAELLHDDLMARAPEDIAVQRVDRVWKVHNMAEWRITASRGVTSDSPVLGSHEWNLDTVLYSPPINKNWRVFAGTGYSEADFDEGTGHYSWTRAGAEWRSRDITAQAEVSGNRYGHGTKTGAAATIFVDLNDHWQVGAGAAWRSRETPLRALKNDITSNSLQASLRWRGDERREWTLSVTPSFFSDGNNRLEARLNGRQRLYTTPTIKLDALFEISASHNSHDDNANYFNPKSDLTVVPALQLTHTLYQRYEKTWEQQFLLGAGTYAQQHHGTGAIITVGYGQRYRYNDVLDVGFMVTGTSRPYDGQRERDYNFLVNMTYRF